MIDREVFHPEWASWPGETIKDILLERGVAPSEFALQVGQTIKQVKDLLEGRTPITLAVARSLSELLGASPEFWMSRDLQYRKDLMRLSARDREWVDAFPIRDMVDLGWIPPVTQTGAKVQACLQFFDVQSVPDWHHKYSALQELVAFRTSPAHVSTPGAIAAWLRQGEIEAEEVPCARWDQTRFGDSLFEMRSLTRIKNPERFVPRLRTICASAGVAAVVVRAPSGCRASGATRFLSDDKALLQLSFRYLTDDHFWFTFFHEAGHLLLHGGKRIFLEGAGSPPTAEEQEANDYAASVLLPDEYQQEFMKLRESWTDVIRFAVRAGVSPGIVVGQLQHTGRIGHSELNRLKRRYRWNQ